MIKLDERKIFTGFTTPLTVDKIFITGTLTCELFEVANVLVFVRITANLVHRRGTVDTDDVIVQMSH